MSNRISGVVDDKIMKYNYFSHMISTTDTSIEKQTSRFSIPDKNGRFGPYGGCYVPETLFYPLKELEEAYHAAKDDPSFKGELEKLLKENCGG